MHYMFEFSSFIIWFLIMKIRVTFDLTIVTGRPFIKSAEKPIDSQSFSNSRNALLISYCKGLFEYLK